MFQSLSQRLTGILDKVRGQGALSESDVDQALREIRIALLEADVALPVARDFIARVKEKAIGQNIVRSISPGQMVTKIVHDHLVEMLGSQSEGLNLNATPPIPVMMIGLQGSGKTTSTAKLALLLSQKHRKKVLMASLDVYRPAAQEQLAQLGEQTKIDTLPIVEGQKPLDIAKRAMDYGAKTGCDLVLLDTAGRLHIDDALMAEIQDIQRAINPKETLLVADSMTGQDAVNMARAFHENCPITGIVLTRVDGDARGGAALSMKFVTGQPIKFIGYGEKVDQFGPFEPTRIADRILDQGDVVALVEKAATLMNDQDSEKIMNRLAKGRFDLNDMATQIDQTIKMGGMSGILEFLPGVSKIKDQMQKAGINDNMLKRQKAIIMSMTPMERRNPHILNASRKKRVSKGCGQDVAQINKLLKQFEQMQALWKKMNKGGFKNFMPNQFKSLFNR